MNTVKITNFFVTRHGGRQKLIYLRLLSQEIKTTCLPVEEDVESGLGTSKSSGRCTSTNTNTHTGTHVHTYYKN